MNACICTFAYFISQFDVNQGQSCRSNDWNTLNELSYRTTHGKWLVNRRKPKIIRHVAWSPLLRLLSRYPVTLSSLYNTSEDRAPVYFICGCPIFKWVAGTLLEGETPGYSSLLWPWGRHALSCVSPYIITPTLHGDHRCFNKTKITSTHETSSLFSQINNIIMLHLCIS